MLIVTDVEYHTAAEDHKEVVIYYTYQSDYLEFRGNARLTENEYKRSGTDDEYIMKCILQRELNWWINYGN